MWPSALGRMTDFLELSAISVAPCSELRHALAQLEARNGDEVYVIGAVSEAQRAGARPEPGKREVVRDAPAAVRLYGNVQDLQHCGGRQHLCCSNLAPGLQQAQRSSDIPLTVLLFSYAPPLHSNTCRPEIASQFSTRCHIRAQQMIARRQAGQANLSYQAWQVRVRQGSAPMCTA